MQDEPLMLRRKRKYESEGPAAKHATMWVSGDAAGIMRPRHATNRSRSPPCARWGPGR